MSRALTADDPLLAAFHRGIYWEAFADRHEPLASWQAALRGERGYELTVRVVEQGGAVVAGICYERYPRSGCGLVTYLVVAPEIRRGGIGRALLMNAAIDLYQRGAPIVLGEVADPDQLARFVRWGARVVEGTYVQPALGPGLARAHDLTLVALAGDQPLPAGLAGTTLRAFIDEFYEIVEGGPPDPAIAIRDRVALRER